MHAVIVLIESAVGLLKGFSPDLGPAGVRVLLLGEAQLLLPRLVHVLLLVQLGHLHVELGEGTARVDAAHLYVEKAINPFTFALACPAEGLARDLEELGVILRALPLDAARLQVSQGVVRRVNNAEEQVVIVATLIEDLGRSLRRLGAIAAVNGHVVKEIAIFLLLLNRLKKLGYARIKAPLVVHLDVRGARTLRNQRVQHLELAAGGRAWLLKKNLLELSIKSVHAVLVEHRIGQRNDKVRVTIGNQVCQLLVVWVEVGVALGVLNHIQAGDMSAKALQIFDVDAARLAGTAHDNNFLCFHIF